MDRRKPLDDDCSDTKKRPAKVAAIHKEEEEEKEEVQAWHGEGRRATYQKPKPTGTDTSSAVPSPNVTLKKRAPQTREARLQAGDNTRTAEDNDDADILKIVEKRCRDAATSMEDNDDGDNGETHSSLPPRVSQHGIPKHTVSDHPPPSTSTITSAVAPPPNNTRAQTAPVSSRTSKLPRNSQEAAVTPGAYRTAPGQKLRRNRAARYSLVTGGGEQHSPDQTSDSTTHSSLPDHGDSEERLQTADKEMTTNQVDNADDTFAEREALEERKQVLQQTHIISTRSLVSTDDYSNDEESATSQNHNKNSSNNQNSIDKEKPEEDAFLDGSPQKTQSPPIRQQDREMAELRKRVLQNTNLISTACPGGNGNGNGNAVVGRQDRDQAEHRKRILQHTSTISTTSEPPSDFQATVSALLEHSPLPRPGSAPVMQDVSSSSRLNDDCYNADDYDDDPEWETPPQQVPQQESQEGMRGDSFLVEATLVANDESRRRETVLQDCNAFIEAKALNSNDIMWAFLSSRKGMLIVCLAVLLIVGVIVGMALGLGNGSDLTAAPTFEPTSSPTQAPTVTFTIDMLPEFSRSVILDGDDPESPQARAWEWLENDNFLNDYPLSRQIQRFALVTFYYATGGPRWRINSQWLNFSVSECEWFSTEIAGRSQCPDPTDREAVLERVALFSNGLSGTLPPELSLLSGLQSLNLGVSSLDGTIPSELGLLTKLVNLGLNDADLGGAIPITFGQMTRLEVLNLATNEFRGRLFPPIFQNMTSLKKVQLDHNLFLGTLPTTFWYLKQLTDVDLSSCRFSGSIPSEFGLATSIVSMKANNNLLRGSLPNLTNLTNLLELDLTSNLLSGPVANLPSSLTELHLGYNEITAANFAHMASLTSLSSLSLEGCHLEGTISTEVGSVTSLKYCNLQQNRLSGTIPTEIGLAKYLNVLELSENNMLHGAIPSEIGLLTDLEALTLANNQLNSTLPTELGQARNLVDLDVSMNALSGDIPSEMGHLRLEFLDLSFNLLSSSLPSELGLCHTMISIDVASCNFVNGPLPHELGRLSFLELLSLSKTSISGSIPQAYGGMTSLMVLQLDSCMLSSTIPTELGLLTLLRAVDLSRNALSGGLPPVFRELNRLRTLRLDRNFIGTTIPTELGLFDDLQHLSCSGCGLIGTIPSELHGLTDISEIDISQNNLEGPILPPTGRTSPAMRSLKLSQNNFTDTIPTVIGLMTILEHLAVDFNALQGNLPSQLGLLTGLTALHLDANSFSGPLPSELALLTNLVVLELDNNQNISGLIPLEFFGMTNLNEFDLFRTLLTGSVPDEFCAKFPGLMEVNCSLVNCSCCECK